MAGLNTGGFALSALDHAPPIPSNVGKVDVGSIYDRVVQGLNTSDAMRTALARQQTEDAQMKAAQATALATQQVAPAQAAADVATAGQTAALASPDLVQKKVANTGVGLDADLAAEQARRDNDRFLGGLTPAQRIALASPQGGLPTGTTNTTVRGLDGNVQQVTQKTATLGGQTVPLARSESDYPSTPILTPIPGPNGTTMGTVLSSVGPAGPTTRVANAPLAALNNINAGTTYKLLGQTKDAGGNDQFQIQAFTQSAIGGAPKPVGSPTTVNSIANLPGIDPNVSQSAKPFISSDANKAIGDVQDSLDTLNKQKIELQNIQNAADNYAQDTTGKFVGPIRAFLGDSNAQSFIGSVQQSLSSALQPLRGTGRVSNNEFNQALSALPRDTDQADVIQHKLQYLNLVNDWATARNQAILDNLGKGENRYQAYRDAQQSTPIPEVPNFYEGKTAVVPASTGPAGTPATAAPGATGAVAAPTQVGGFKIIKVGG